MDDWIGTLSGLRLGLLFAVLQSINSLTDEPLKLLATPFIDSGTSCQRIDPKPSLTLSLFPTACNRSIGGLCLLPSNLLTAHHPLRQLRQRFLRPDRMQQQMVSAANRQAGRLSSSSAVLPHRHAGRCTGHIRRQHPAGNAHGSMARGHTRMQRAKVAPSADTRVR